MSLKPWGPVSTQPRYTRLWKSTSQQYDRVPRPPAPVVQNRSEAKSLQALFYFTKAGHDMWVLHRVSTLSWASERERERGGGGEGSAYVCVCVCVCVRACVRARVCLTRDCRAKAARYCQWLDYKTLLTLLLSFEAAAQHSSAIKNLQPAV